MASQKETLRELWNRTKDDPEKRAALIKLTKSRGIDIARVFAESDIPLRSDVSVEESLAQKQARETGTFEAFGVGAGKGFLNVGRGLGIAEPATERETTALEALRRESPKAFTGGEIAGEAAPFLLPGAGIGAVGSAGTRVALSAGLGAIEGGITARGRGEDVVKGAGIGAGIGAVSEAFLPVLGRVASRFIKRVTGRQPTGALIDAAGRPTRELQEALDAQGLKFEDLSQEAIESITPRQGADPEQVARQALFAEEQVPPSLGELTQGQQQIGTEQKLLQSVEEAASEPFRQFKLAQSEKIKSRLRGLLKEEPGVEETGNLIQDALTGRKNLLRTQKNELYEKVAETVKNSDDFFIFPGAIAEALPDTKKLRQLAIQDDEGVKKLQNWLSEFGVIGPSEATLKAGVEPDMLSLENFETFRQGLNNIARGSDAIKVATGPVMRALDSEIDNLIDNAITKKVAPQVVKDLKRARRIVRTLKTEFSPQSTIGKIIDVKKDGVTQVTAGSKVYDKIAGKAVPVEDVRKLMGSLKNSGEKGEQAIASIQGSVLLDLMDAGFGTESRKVSGVKMFNPTAFKRRMKKVGLPKIGAIFRNEPDILKRLKNINKISSELIPPNAAVPKGSAPIIVDLANKLGFSLIAGKIPGGAFVWEPIRKAGRAISSGVATQRAAKAAPEIRRFDDTISRLFPNIGRAVLKAFGTFGGGIAEDVASNIFSGEDN